MRKILFALFLSSISLPAFAKAYELTDNGVAADRQEVIREADHASIPNDPRNKDFRAYLAWLNAGNKPDAATTEPPIALRSHK
jgi:hypothetical protein